MPDYILSPHDITKRQYNEDIPILIIREYIDTLVLGSTLYGES